MRTIDDLITAVLQDEARQAPDADAFVTRILGEMEPDVTPRSRPRWDLSVPVWTVPMTAAAVAALIVLAAVMSSLWLSVDGRQHGGATTEPTSTVPTPPADSTTSNDHAARLPGWVELSSGPVHIEMDADDSDRAWWRNWTVGCSMSVLSTVESGDFACAGQPGRQPRYEVMVASALEPANLTSTHIALDDPLAPSVLRGGLDHGFCGGECPSSVGGTSAEVRSTTAQVRYDCPGPCGQLVDRQVTVIGFTGYDAHITILSPVGESLFWLTDYVYTDLQS